MLTALLAYLIDRIFGELPVKHPVVWMGEYISWFESRFWRDSVTLGILLALSLLAISTALSLLFVWGVGFLPSYAQIALTAVVASSFIASNMLHSSVKNALEAQDKRAALSMLVSRDTVALETSDINKALIETYAENLNDAVIAPLFYLCLFGLPGIVAYKAINTLDSMVGYHTARYERFGKFSARIDDIVGFIPARITALLITAASLSFKSAKDAIRYGGGHESPNAGYPIAAIAGAVGVRLGGNTVYHGELKSKPYFGNGEANITDAHVRMALSLQPRFDILILTILLCGAVI
ncbi:MAG: adenosylcobinamide-phosphate synthase CbiB [Campylobacterales bacterium]